jgi:hypothetical protein
MDSGRLDGDPVEEEWQVVKKKKHYFTRSQQNNNNNENNQDLLTPNNNNDLDGPVPSRLDTLESDLSYQIDMAMRQSRQGEETILTSTPDSSELELQNSNFNAAQLSGSADVQPSHSDSETPLSPNAGQADDETKLLQEKTKLNRHPSTYPHEDPIPPTLFPPLPSRASRNDPNPKTNNSNNLTRKQTPFLSSNERYNPIDSRRTSLCPICNRYYSPKTLYEHARKIHREHKWTKREAEQVGGLPCSCGTLCRSSAGLKKHAKSDCCASRENTCSFINSKTDNVSTTFEADSDFEDVWDRKITHLKGSSNSGKAILDLALPDDYALPTDPLKEADPEHFIEEFLKENQILAMRYARMPDAGSRGSTHGLGYCALLALEQMFRRRAGAADWKRSLDLRNADAQFKFSNFLNHIFSIQETAGFNVGSLKTIIDYFEAHKSDREQCDRLPVNLWFDLATLGTSIDLGFYATVWRELSNDDGYVTPIWTTSHETAYWRRILEIIEGEHYIEFAHHHYNVVEPPDNERAQVEEALSDLAKNFISHLREKSTTPSIQANNPESLHDPQDQLFVNFKESSTKAILNRLSELPEPSPTTPKDHISEFIKQSEILCLRYMNDEVAQAETLRRILCLPKLGLSRKLTHGHISRTRKLLRMVSASDSTFSVPLPKQQIPAHTPINSVKRAEILMGKGLMGRAGRVLFDSSKVADASDPLVMEKLEKLQCPPDNAQLPRSGTARPSAITQASVAVAVNSLSVDTGSGPSGWSAFLLKKVFQQSECFQKFLGFLVNQIAQGKAPCAELLCASRLVPLKKDDGGIRPIAVGEIFYRVASKSVLSTQKSPKSLLREQLGVGTPGGVEPIITKIRDHLNLQDKFIMKLDFTNAFNSMSRQVIMQAALEKNPQLCRFLRWSYGGPSILLVQTGSKNPVYLHSAQGVKQGDPIGPYLFSLGYADILKTLQDSLKNQAEVWSYLDDTYVFGTVALKDTIIKTVNQFFRYDPGGLHLNQQKTGIYDSVDYHDSGLKALGTALGTLKYRRDFLEENIASMKSKLSAMSDLSKQSAQLLLRTSVIPSMMHIMRNLDSVDLMNIWEEADRLTLEFLSKLISPTTEFEDYFPLLATLPCRKGGLGFISMHRVQPIAYLAATDAASFFIRSDEENLLDPPLSQAERTRGLWTDLVEDVEAMIPRGAKGVFADHFSPVSFRWMLMMPGPDRHCKLEDREVSIGLMIRSIHSGTSGPCSCHQPNYPSHDLVCLDSASFRTARHESVKRVLAESYQSISCEVRIEPFSERSTSGARADLSVRGPAARNGTHMVVDVTVVASVNNVRTDVDLHQVMQARYDTKIERYQSHYTDGEFFPFVLTAGGTICKKSLPIIKAFTDAGGDRLALVTKLSVSLLRTRAKAFYIT